jgi:hypothetical protein
MLAYKLPLPVANRPARRAIPLTRDRQRIGAYSADVASRLVLIAAAVAVGCAGARPEPRAQAALYRDLERMVSISAAAGWNIDRFEIEEMLPAALESVCRVPLADRRAVLAWIDAEIMDAGGPVEVAYRERGKKLDKVKRLVELDRIKRLLARAVVIAADDCPFWIEPSERFAGRQLLDDRWVLSFGGGGKGIVVISEGELDLSAGGAGRLLVGRAFGPHWMVSTGVEVGALASFPRDGDGERAGLVLGADVVAPLVLRYRLVNSYFEFQGGYLGQVREGSNDVVSGVNAGIAVGAQAGRARWFLPGAAFGLTVERTFPGEMEPSLWAIKAGFRVAIDLSL